MRYLAGSQVFRERRQIRERSGGKRLTCLILLALHKGVADQINIVSRLVSFADSNRA